MKNEGEETDMYIVGISGGSGSGKSTMCGKLKEKIADLKVESIMADTFFNRPLPKMTSPMTGEEMDDFNCPESINYEGLYEKILEIKKNPDLQVLLVEGNGIFYHEKIRELFDLKVFMDLEIEHRMYRRIVRNIAAGRGSMEDIAEFYLKSARFSEQKYLIPTKRYADIVLNGDNYDTIGLDVVETYIRKQV